MPHVSPPSRPTCSNSFCTLEPEWLSQNPVWLWIKCKLLTRCCKSLLSILLLQYSLRQFPSLFLSILYQTSKNFFQFLSSVCFLSLLSLYIFFPFIWKQLSTFSSFWTSTSCFLHMTLKSPLPGKPSVTSRIGSFTAAECSGSHLIAPSLKSLLPTRSCILGRQRPFLYFSRHLLPSFQHNLGFPKQWLILKDSLDLRSLPASWPARYSAFQCLPSSLR